MHRATRDRGGEFMKRLAAAVLACAIFALPVWAQSPGTSTQKMPAAAEAGVVKVRGTVSAIDKENKTITLKGPKGRTLTLDVKDPSKLDVVKVGDPVVVAYVEAIAIQVKKAGTAQPGVSTQESRVTSKPGETPAGAIAREVTVVGTITAIDKKAQKVTIKGPQGNQETVKVKDPKNIEGVKVGDMVEITFTQALAVSLDKSAQQPAAKQ
jgi:Cu/Ag efflux protein CusF